MTNASKAWIAAPSGLRLTADEKAFFADERPWGFIVFGRNIGEASQVRDLVAELKEAGGRATTPVFVDQEGGRVQRLRPPLAPAYPPAADLGRLHGRDPRLAERAAWLQGRLLALDLAGFGLNADCIPCLDVPVPGADSVIGDRAYGKDPQVVAALGRAAADGLMAGGLLPVMKHVPGHGRGNADSHLALPQVDAAREDLERTDFPPFAALAGLPAAMTAHVLYTAIDARRPATLSPIVIEEVIRGTIGFDGLLMTDDMSMKALQGDFYDLGRAALTAGCDILLHCNGDMAEMRKIAHAAPPLGRETARRAAACEAVIGQGERADEPALRAEFAGIVSRVA
ncbi:beta-N-acetylhexosaminidase [Aurantimonas sp. Leaf443]|uniref:beta-N-acetylhexosaminidase n=1 Tax=Aurantimonas sp. Leaf443 TaxID=1736378 RepID=UPI0006F543FC|nr:beta-N-acetylhexosaminidase [Aurantimonas sp. Leaf443]KQT82548.1 beta-hexosaminidase [Aurantimonas sp. Leaf443]